MTSDFKWDGGIGTSPIVIRTDDDIRFGDKTDLWLAMISSFDSVVTVYVGLPCELSNPHSLFNQLMKSFADKNNVCS